MQVNNLSQFKPKLKIDSQDILSSNNFDGRGARPIANSTIINFINDSLKFDYLYDDKILPTFLDTYYEWIQKSKLNEFHGLNKFNKLDYVHGTSQCFDFFFLKNKNRRMRCFRGDFAYHKISWKNYFHNGWQFIEDDELKENDCFVVSVPFSDSGGLHPQTEDILKKCDNLKIPVLIDGAYYSIAGGIKIDLDRPCIDTITFSLSKPFYGAERLRIGMRCCKEFQDDTINFCNEFQQINRLGAGVGNDLCNNFHTDFNYQNFRKMQIKLCSQLNIEPTNTVIFGQASKDHKDFGHYDRGSIYKRVCISKLLGDCNQ